MARTEIMTINFLDDELGDAVWNIEYDFDKYNFHKCFEIATKTMSLPFGKGFEQLKEENPWLVKEFYDIADKIMQHGEHTGITDYRICYFLMKAFDFKCDPVHIDASFDITGGKWI